MDHLFPGDGDEHGATLVAGVHVGPDRVRLLVRDVRLAVEGVDHVAGRYGYRMLTAQFIRPALIQARDERLVYLSVHNHGGDDRVAFSSDDFASHERGYPALLDIVAGMPVGALVFARSAVAGDIWLPSGARVPLERAVIVGKRRSLLFPAPPRRDTGKASSFFDRQVRLFGESGQAILRETRIGIVGLGGVGSLLAELLGRLGVGEFVLMDPERADISNLSRLVGARRTDVLVSEELLRSWGWIGRWLDVLRARKIDLASRNILRANRAARITRIFGSLADQSNAAALLDCDFVFLAADQMIARLVFNAVVHQYLIPGVQVGARVVSDPDTGVISDVFAVSRPVSPMSGCLWCNRLIDAAKLQDEAIGEGQARAQAYGTESAAPSVITLNALAAAEAVNLFLFYMTGLADSEADWAYWRFHPLTRSIRFDEPRANQACIECGRGPQGRFGAGTARDLPTR